MISFDYESAWREVAKPAYEALPQNLRDLLERVAIEAAELGQKPDLSMPWPDDRQLPDSKRIEGSDLRERFGKIPAEFLALAARVIHEIGHWYPSGADLVVPGRSSGAYWKFSHYADQSLRERLIAATSADAMRANGPFQVHQGAIRFCYSSCDMWTWAEVAPATVEGLTRAGKIADELSAKFGALPAVTDGRHKTADREARDSTAYQFFEDLKTRDLDWPAAWRPIMNTAAYMREAQEIAARRLERVTPEQRAAAIAKRRAKVIELTTATIRKAERERDGIVWLIDHSLDVDNVIFYSHDNGGAGVFCFGWRDKVIDTVRDRILAVISDFPYAYRIKCADGRTLEGGIG